MSLQRIILLSLGLALTASCGRADSGSFLLAVEPSDLEPPCKLQDLVLLVDDWGSVGGTVVDSNGIKLQVFTNESGIFFESRSGYILKSNEGSREERCLLGMFQSWYRKYYDPILAAKVNNLSPAETHRWFQQEAVKRFIQILEPRCRPHRTK